VIYILPYELNGFPAMFSLGLADDINVSTLVGLPFLEATHSIIDLTNCNHCIHCKTFNAIWPFKAREITVNNPANFIYQPTAGAPIMLMTSVSGPQAPLLQLSSPYYSFIQQLQHMGITPIRCLKVLTLHTTTTISTPGLKPSEMSDKTSDQSPGQPGQHISFREFIQVWHFLSDCPRSILHSIPLKPAPI
jgi:hypothetical protein